ncbi:RBBP8 N-terminal-like protein [Ctenodactylus gundi]
MESFTELLNRLKDVHEKEVLGLQNKLLELNSERCRDAQRVEELFTKNHQLREQQKALKENLRVLENRLRAGLCDRCMVTQELARKRQLEFESSHLQSLQRICVLTNEMTRLKEENKVLKEEVKRLLGLEHKPIPLARESTSETPSPLLLPSPSGWKAVTEKPAEGHEEAEEDHPGTDKPVGYRTSPVAKISPGANLPEPRASDMSPQHISNQLHGTVAVVRPGSRACPADCGPADGTPPLPDRSSPPSPVYEHSLPLDSLLRASQPSDGTFETLKHPLQADRLCLLNHHLSLLLRSSHGNTLSPITATHSLQPQDLTAGEAEASEEPTGLLSLPSSLVGMQDPRLERALHLLLAQQHLRARAQTSSARLRAPSPLQERPPSPPVSSDSKSLKHVVGRAALTTAALPSRQNPQPTSSPQRKKVIATQDYASDKPLDLSDRGRGQDGPKSTGQFGPLSPTLAYTPSPDPHASSGPLNHNPKALSNGTKGIEEPPSPTDLSHPLSGRDLSLPSPGRTGNEARGMLKLAPYPQSPDADGPAEPSKGGAQKPELDELEKPDTPDREVGPSSEAGAKTSMPEEGHRCFCPEEPQQGLPQKRKWALDAGSTASKKLSRGRKKAREPPVAAEGPGSPGEAKDYSSSSSNSSCQDT